MGPVDERRQMYALDCYFRQTWIDNRLRYNNSRLPELSMNWQFLSRIWRPDTYFVNGKDSYLHMMTVPNRFVGCYSLPTLDRRWSPNAWERIEETCPNDPLAEYVYGISGH